MQNKVEIARASSPGRRALWVATRLLFLHCRTRHGATCLAPGGNDAALFKRRAKQHYRGSVLSQGTVVLLGRQATDTQRPRATAVAVVSSKMRDAAHAGALGFVLQLSTADVLLTQLLLGFLVGVRGDTTAARFAVAFRLWVRLCATEVALTLLSENREAAPARTLAKASCLQTRSRTQPRARASAPQ